MNSNSSIFTEWLFIGLIIFLFYLLRNHLFKKYDGINYLFIFSAISTFGAGCFFLGKASEKFSEGLSVCPYKDQAVWCYVLNYLSIFPQIILIVFGLIFLLGVIEYLEVRNKNDD